MGAGKRLLNVSLDVQFAFGKEESHRQACRSLIQPFPFPPTHPPTLVAKKHSSSTKKKDQKEKKESKKHKKEKKQKKEKKSSHHHHKKRKRDDDSASDDSGSDRSEEEGGGEEEKKKRRWKEEEDEREERRLVKEAMKYLEKHGSGGGGRGSSSSSSKSKSKSKSNSSSSSKDEKKEKKEDRKVRKKERKEKQEEEGGGGEGGPPARPIPEVLSPEDDYYRRQVEFRVWLRLVKSINFEVGKVEGGRKEREYVIALNIQREHICDSCTYLLSLPPSLPRLSPAKKHFVRFVSTWNKGLLPDMYYDGVPIHLQTEGHKTPTHPFRPPSLPPSLDPFPRQSPRALRPLRLHLEQRLASRHVLRGHSYSYANGSTQDWACLGVCQKDERGGEGSVGKDG